MNREYIMMKDTPVLEIDNYTCKILDFDKLPISLRYTDVNYDDVMHGWNETRTMNIGKTNGKKILSAFGISQNNPYLIARVCHFASLTDCYWLKEESENLSWKDINLFQNDFEKVITSAALFGVNARITISNRIHTPELTTQGVAAKAWVRESDHQLYLYKIGKIEIAASKILDTLGISHATYELSDMSSLYQLTDETRLQQIIEKGEMIVKSKIITSEKYSIVTWEDFSVFCDRNGKNPYKITLENYPDSYYDMQIADYILGNEDRHTANYGFYIENDTGKIIGMHPLMDHDHAFSNDNIISQTTEDNLTLKEAATLAIHHRELPFEKLLKMKMPIELSEMQWDGVIERTKYCIEMTK